MKMKTLWLVRHAKSSWDNEVLNDFDRPLNARGYRDAQAMAIRMGSRRDEKPGLLVSSPAIRAVTTALLFARILKFPADNILLREALYASGTGSYLNVIRELPDGKTSVLLFGHNPVITETVNLLAGTALDDLPTTGMVCIGFAEEKWERVAAGKGKLLLLDFPKKTTP